MNLERWQDIVETIESSFSVEEKGRFEDEDGSGGYIEYIVFSGPLGRLRLEFSTRPVILDTKTKYTKRIGSDIKVENIYSDTAKSHTLEVWKWDDAADDWIAFESKLF